MLKVHVLTYPGDLKGRQIELVDAGHKAPKVRLGGKPYSGCWFYSIEQKLGPTVEQ